MQVLFKQACKDSRNVTDIVENQVRLLTRYLTGTIHWDSFPGSMQSHDKDSKMVDLTKGFRSTVLHTTVLCM